MKAGTTPLVCARLFAHGKPPCETITRRRAAATASRPHVRDVRERPSCGTGRNSKATDLPMKGSGIFLRERLDRFLSREVICPSG
jgi:hypothetical protein